MGCLRLGPAERTLSPELPTMFATLLGHALSTRSPAVSRSPGGNADLQRDSVYQTAPSSTSDFALALTDAVQAAGNPVLSMGHRRKYDDRALTRHRPCGSTAQFFFPRYFVAKDDVASDAPRGCTLAGQDCEFLFIHQLPRLPPHLGWADSTVPSVACQRGLREFRGSFGGRRTACCLKSTLAPTWRRAGDQIAARQLSAGAPPARYLPQWTAGPGSRSRRRRAQMGVRPG